MSILAVLSERRNNSFGQENELASEGLMGPHGKEMEIKIDAKAPCPQVPQ